MKPEFRTWRDGWWPLLKALILPALMLCLLATGVGVLVFPALLWLMLWFDHGSVMD